MCNCPIPFLAQNDGESIGNLNYSWYQVSILCIRAGGTAQRSRQLPRAAGILERQSVSGKKRRKGEEKNEKIEESEKRKGQRKIEKRNAVNGLVQ